MTNKEEIDALVNGDTATHREVMRLVDAIILERDAQWKSAIEKAEREYPDSNSLYCAVQDIMEAMSTK